jgi:hypothetical protein
MKEEKVFHKNTKLFPNTKPIDQLILKNILYKNWGKIFKEGDELIQLKASQNCTYKSNEYIIRVTIDENGNQFKELKMKKISSFIS